MSASGCPREILGSLLNGIIRSVSVPMIKMTRPSAASLAVTRIVVENEGVEWIKVERRAGGFAVEIEANSYILSKTVDRPLEVSLGTRSGHDFVRWIERHPITLNHLGGRVGVVPFEHVVDIALSPLVAAGGVLRDNARVHYEGSGLVELQVDYPLQIELRSSAGR